MDSDFITVLIPTYNRRKLLERALHSVVVQKGDFEIIIIDDASSDNTEEFVREYQKNSSANIIYLKHDKNKGVNAARNLGIQHATGKWIAFLDDDDEFFSGALEIIRKYIKELPDHFNVAYFNSIINNGVQEIRGGFQFDSRLQFYDPTYEETMLKFNLKGDCKPVFRKSLFTDKTYLFPEIVNGFESYSMNLIARDHKGIRYFNDTTTLIHFTDEVSHVSHTAPRKNPKSLRNLHIRQLSEHRLFYGLHKDALKNKYATIIKLSLRTYDIPRVILYVFKFLIV